MIWKFRGKYEGKNINEVPTDYLQWIIENSKNEDAKNLAELALEYRRRNEVTKSSVSKLQYQNHPKEKIEEKNQKSTDIDKFDMIIRGFIILASAISNPSNPFYNLDKVFKYVVFNEIPLFENFETKEKEEFNIFEEEKEN